MSLSSNVSEKAALIWAIADKLTGVYKPHEYGEVILPMTVIRRFDCIIADTKAAVLEKYESVKSLPMRDVLLRKASGYDFYNTSKYDFDKLLDDPDNIEANFRDYLNGFSENVQDIIEKFKFDGHITTMANKGILYIVIKEFTSPRAKLHPSVVSNLEMGYIFEEIIRRFSEAHNEDAGQHYTPREVIELMVNILFYDDNDVLSGNNVAKTIYENIRPKMIQFNISRMCAGKKGARSKIRVQCRCRVIARFFLSPNILQITLKVFTSGNKRDIFRTNLQVTPNVDTKGDLKYEDGI